MGSQCGHAQGAPTVSGGKAGGKRSWCSSQTAEAFAGSDIRSAKDALHAQASPSPSLALSSAVTPYFLSARPMSSRAFSHHRLKPPLPAPWPPSPILPAPPASSPIRPRPTLPLSHALATSAEPINRLTPAFPLQVPLLSRQTPPHPHLEYVWKQEQQP